MAIDRVSDWEPNLDQLHYNQYRQATDKAMAPLIIR